MPDRRTLLATTLATLVPNNAHAQTPQDDPAAWAAFKAQFLTPDGRIVDTGNNNVSHTESQGWGMLFAVTFDDREAFDRIESWTRRTLRRPNDALHHWRYTPGAPNPIDDPNNATDGDLFIAYASTLAAARWRRPELTRQAQATARSILSLLVQKIGGLTLLAPGVDGFKKDDGLVINPSYYAFTALEALARVAPSPLWAALRSDGITAIGKARFGIWELPPDWVFAGNDGSFKPAPDQPPRYSYDAIRVPLYLAWAGIDSPVLRSVATWWRHATPPPAWVDVTSGATAEYAAGPGMESATRLAINDPVPPPEITPAMDYYTAALCLLTRIAARDIAARQPGLRSP